MPNSTVSYLWRDHGATRGFRAGVSLHSHTNQSQETLDFLANVGNQYPMIRPFLARLENRSESNHGVRVNYSASYWTPPMTPKLAFDLESKQIEDLDIASMVSLSDHDNIKAPMLLRTVPSARQIPVSVEWSAPYGGIQDFHLGIHNLPSAQGAQWMKTFKEFTAKPSDRRLTELLSALHALPNVLIIFNHPMWDLYEIGCARHALRVDDFMRQNGRFIDAMELNGLRGWNENRVVRALAARWNKLLISGGDRHGLEPNGNVNLTNATSFNEFVHEIRDEGRSHVLFMPQYAQPWKHRIMQSTLDAVRNYPDFPEGSRRWDERVYHPDANGIPQPVSALWPSGHAPLMLRLSIGIVRLMGSAPLRGSLRLAWNESRQLHFALGDGEAAS